MLSVTRVLRQELFSLASARPWPGCCLCQGQTAGQLDLSVKPEESAVPVQIKRQATRQIERQVNKPRSE